ncbi:hypothetical protein LG943_25910 [Streptomonospora sp. S1-112]|uniref:Antibiotic biosynthesis monooxygenase n=1 Tax=Streptomonospora mangrovi TaxID=2883123 RepID=A0A9X3NRA3_9ACTN|nr:hypothetical protein [Streptomonospora mangrovi]MDA0567730.1 hypothetical protein [Streptomonospora mangrovi]
MTTYGNGALLFRNTMRIADGHLDAFKEAVDRAVSFVEEHAPQLMVNVYVDEERMLAYSFQLYADSDAVRTHWRLSDPYIKAVMEHCTVERFDVYGTPDPDITEALARPGGTPTPGDRVPHFTGFVRLAAG